MTVPLWILATLAALGFLRLTRELCIPIALAGLISFALAPVVRWLMHLRLPRWAAVTTLMLLLAAAAAWGGYALGDRAVRAVQELPQTVRQIRQRMEGSGGTTIARLRTALEEMRTATTVVTGQQQGGGQVGRQPQSGGQGGGAEKKGAGGASASGGTGNLVARGSAGLVAFLGHLVVIVFLVFFLLLTGSTYRDRIISLAGGRLSAKREAAAVIDEITNQIERFLVVRVITGVIVGIATALALVALGGPSPALWGTLAGIFNSIPYFGPLIVSGGLFIVGSTTDGLGMGLKLSAVAMVITTIEGWLLTPPLLGRAARMHTLAVFLGLLLWSWAWGIWGTILAVPMLVVIKSVSDHVDALKPLSVLLAQDDT